MFRFLVSFTSMPLLGSLRLWLWIYIDVWEYTVCCPLNAIVSCFGWNALKAVSSLIW